MYDFNLKLFTFLWQYFLWNLFFCLDTKEVLDVPEAGSVAVVRWSCIYPLVSVKTMLFWKVELFNLVTFRFITFIIIISIIVIVIIISGQVGLIPNSLQTCWNF